MKAGIPKATAALEKGLHPFRLEYFLGKPGNGIR